MTKRLIKLLTLGALLITPFACAQKDSSQVCNFNHYSYSYEDINITFCEPLEPFIANFLKDAVKYDIDLTNLKYLKEVMMLSDSTFTYLGQTSRLEDDGGNKLYSYIVFNKEIPPYLPTLVNAIIYHEFAHALLWNSTHCESITCPYIMQAEIEPETIIKYWNEQSKEQFFYWLKEEQKRSKEKKI